MASIFNCYDGAYPNFEWYGTGSSIFTFGTAINNQNYEVIITTEP